ncbi:SAM-dependent DNA methyltransferase [Nocardioides sp. GY 10127]|uniref:Eco57I restriction-modification methylase domain-containing protein n=1 Tax=Nocardioides sp. GY 10127 TaxID=2569762 RepID=UPI0010A8A5F8|nr:SAM-dependent DNA methyltransferase [Nocardioides sp. GY 10127]TIC86405.1 SAM-dependent DNA methyltransferase [Nocardioides sp. GY 10127]
MPADVAPVDVAPARPQGQSSRQSSRPSRAVQRALVTAVEAWGDGLRRPLVPSGDDGGVGPADDPGALPGLVRLVLRLVLHRRLADLGVLPAPPAPGSAEDTWEAHRRLAATVAGDHPSADLPVLGGLFRGGLPPRTRIVDEAWRRGTEALLGVLDGEEGACDLGALHQLLLSLAADDARQELGQEVDQGRWVLRRSATGRRSTGSWYTPPDVVDLVLDHALEPVLDAAEAGGPEAAATARLLGVRVCDPAVGAGDFLVAAAARIAARLVRLGTDPSRAVQDAVATCVRGVDLDPVAVDVAAAALQLCVARAGGTPSDLGHHLRHGDALLGATPTLLERGLPALALSAVAGEPREARTVLSAHRRRHVREVAAAAGDPVSVTPGQEAPAADAWCAGFLAPAEAVLRVTDGSLRALAGDGAVDAAEQLAAAVASAVGEAALLHWHLAFPDVHAAGGFDVVVGNPPFLSPLRAGARVSRRRLLVRAAADGLGGPKADDSAYFLLLGTRITRPGGRCGMVLPDSFLSAADVADVRAHLAGSRDLTAVWRGDGTEFDAAVTPVVVVLADRATAGGGASAEPARLVGRPPRRLTGETGDWRTAGWGHLVTENVGGLGGLAGRAGGAVLADLAEVTADYRDQFYGLRGHVHEAEGDALPDPASGLAALVTTGLIDPGVLRWGEATARFDGRTYRRPVVHLRGLPAAMAAWAQRRLRPKLLVATQGRTVEVVLDEDGVLLPCVPVVSVVPRPDGPSLAELAALLSSPAVHDWLRARTLGAGLGHRTLKLAASDLRAVPAPTDREALGRAARVLPAAALGDRDREDALAALTDRAFGLPVTEHTDWAAARASYVAGPGSSGRTPGT